MASILRVSLSAFLVSAWLGTAFAASSADSESMPSAQDDERRPPNVVIVFTDDQGWGDLSCYGSTDIPTPNIDQLAAEGMKFTDFYASQPVCSASRASLLSGCYANRVGISGALHPTAKIGLDPDEHTIAEALKANGNIITRENI